MDKRYVINILGTTQTENFVYFHLEVNEVERYIRVLHEGVAGILRVLGVYDDPMERFVVTPCRDRDDKIYTVEDTILGDHRLLSADNYWDFTSEIERQDHYAPVDFVDILDDDSNPEPDFEHATTVTLISMETIKGLTTEEVDRRTQVLLHGTPELATWEYTSSLSKPANSISSITLAFYRKMGILTASDHLDSLGTFKSALALISKMNSINHENAWSLYQMAYLYLDAMMESNTDDDETNQSFMKQLNGVRTLFFSEDVTQDAPKPEDSHWVEGGPIVPKSVKEPKEPKKATSMGMNLIKQAIANKDKVKPKAKSKKKKKSYDAETIIAKYKSGETTRQIIQELHISSATLYQVLSENDIKLSRYGNKKNKD